MGVELNVSGVDGGRKMEVPSMGNLRKCDEEMKRICGRIVMGIRKRGKEKKEGNFKLKELKV